ncbi:MAG: NADH-quinone oxidoreductase subunit A [Thermodesulfobacteriota bacterium]
MIVEYVPVIYLIVVGIVFGVITVVLSALLGPKRESAEKQAPYECGLPSEGIHYLQTPVKYYIVALLFLIFDLECVFLYPWAVHFNELGVFGFLAMFLFVVILLVSYVYDWKKGALEWE